MKKLPKTLIYLFATSLLTACGADVKAVYDRTLYHTNVFANNFYQDRHATTTFAPTTHRGETITIEINQADVSETIPTTPEDPNGDDYAFQQQLSKALPSLNYGIESKLFDGILYCTDAQRLSKSRLQLLPSGMAYPFSRAILGSSSQTLGFFMKAGADTQSGGRHITDLIVTFSLFKPFEGGYQLTNITLPISGLKPSYYPGYYQVQLPSGTLDGTVGFHFQYEILSPLPQEGLDQLTGVFLYEILMPNVSFSR